MLRLVADTNTVISALLWRGAPHRLVAANEAAQVSFYTSRTLIDELADVIKRPKLARAVRATGKDVEQLQAEYEEIATIVTPRRLPAPVSCDSDDDAVLACALGARADLIVSGDKDLRILGGYRGILILTAAETLARIRTQRTT
ncbi:MAG: putative toxin-antitoxin system toxin component, PIN family [Betaproteobacteria bacterium]|nr:putative toxin-antitoxin system toxin component, PIN family [Betaproteobacteria bacterium]